MKTVGESARRRILALVALALVALVGRLLANAVGAPQPVVRGLYLLGLGSLVAAVLVIATD